MRNLGLLKEIVPRMLKNFYHGLRAEAAMTYYGFPHKELKIIGVTGTDGKTTTSNLIYSILNVGGKRTGLISTVGARIGDNTYDTGLHTTSPEPFLLHRFLRLMVKKGCKYAILEVTSHGLDQCRFFGINFEISVLTNITHEHLDYHKSFENYVKVKAKLFNLSKKAILNRDDSSYEKIKKYIKKDIKIVPYSVFSITPKVLRTIKERFKGEFYNYSNATAAYAVVRELNIDNNTIVSAIKSFPGVPGRMEEIKNGRGFRVIVDFAHTPNALEQVLKVLRKQVHKRGKLIAVFGCAGGRDTEKRPLMGEISAKLADVSVFTAEDPRSEDVNKIIDQMVEGVKKVKEAAKSYFNDLNHHSIRHLFIRIPERGEAISFVIRKIAKRGDTIVICGKGHEKSMAVGDKEYPWSDVKAAKRALVSK